MSFFGEVVSSQTEETSEKKWCISVVARVRPRTPPPPTTTTKTHTMHHITPTTNGDNLCQACLTSCGHALSTVRSSVILPAEPDRVRGRLHHRELLHLKPTHIMMKKSIEWYDIILCSSAERETFLLNSFALKLHRQR